MAWYEKLNELAVKVPDGFPTFDKINIFVKKLITANRVNYHESEALEVTKVIRNSNIDNGAVVGIFKETPNQPIKGKRGVIKPLTPNITQIPLIGEHVVVVEHQGQHYYTGIINKKDNPNENSIQNIEVTKYGKTFERKAIRHVTTNEGDIVYSGRFGQSIKLGGYTENNKPYIKIRSGQKPLSEDENQSLNTPIDENIERDGSSIYLLDNGLPFNAQTDEEKFDGEQITGKKILIKSNGIFISGRDNLKFRAVNNINVNTPILDIISTDIKLGSVDATELQPIVKGDQLKEFLEKMIDDILDGVDRAYATSAKLYISPPGVVGGPCITAGAESIFKIEMAGLKASLKVKLNGSQILSTKVKTT